MPPLTRTIQVYDPPVCCETGICGHNIGPDLANFAAMLNQLQSHGVKIERYNLGQQAMAFAQNPAIKSLPEKEGAEVLPVIFLDGEVRLKGRAPPLPTPALCSPPSHPPSAREGGAVFEGGTVF